MPAAQTMCDRHHTAQGLVQSAKSVTLFLMTELAQQPQQVDALPLGPESLVWRYFGDNRMFLIGPRPAVLQNMLAELGQGVLDHSVFFDDTAARVKRSLPPIYNTVYGADGDNPGQQVRDFHTQIKGNMPANTGLAVAITPSIPTPTSGPTPRSSTRSCTSPTPSSSGSAAKTRNRFTSSPRPGTGATASATGRCPRIMRRSNGIGTA